MVLTYETTRRKLLRGEAEVTIRVMTKDDIPAMRRLDDEITAGTEFANAQRAPGQESYPGGPWADERELLEHFEKAESKGNITLLVEDESGKLVAFADLWAAHEPEPFGDSLDVECIDYLWEYHHLGIETVLLEEAEKVARSARLPALDIGTNTSSGDYPALRRFGMTVFYEYDNVWCRCPKLSPDQIPTYRILAPENLDLSGLIQINHWSPTDFDFSYYPGRPGLHELEIDGRRVVIDLWRLWEPGSEKPIGCELYAPPETLTSPELMNKIAHVVTMLAAEAGAEEIPVPYPSTIPADESLVDAKRREFAFAWMRKKLF